MCQQMYASTRRFIAFSVIIVVPSKYHTIARREKRTLVAFATVSSFGYGMGTSTIPYQWISLRFSNRDQKPAFLCHRHLTLPSSHFIITALHHINFIDPIVQRSSRTRRLSLATSTFTYNIPLWRPAETKPRLTVNA